MKLTQLISFLFVGLVLTNLVHNSVPHHHHNDNINTHEGCEENGCDIADQPTEDPCTHCHAFNGIDYFRVMANVNGSPIKYFAHVIFNLSLAGPELNPGNFRRIYASADLPGHYRGLDRKVTSLRAPPSFC